ncbi:MAG: RNA polymerase subunit sigma [Proteobacteria bacterium]|nr:MAG: RNA polymerase subunit sigma [Pseudomonadota bacterium]
MGIASVTTGSLNRALVHRANDCAPTDVLLLKRIAEGNQLAMRAFFTRHKLRVYRFVLRILQDEALAEDIMSDVFLDVWRQADRFRGGCAPSTWLLAIARNKAVAERRRKRDAALDDDIASTIVDPDGDPGIMLEKKDRKRIIRRGLATLSPEHRQAIDLVYYHEKSITEVAHILNVPEGTVKSRMFEARRRLAPLVASG